MERCWRWLLAYWSPEERYRRACLRLYRSIFACRNRAKERLPNRVFQEMIDERFNWLAERSDEVLDLYVPLEIMRGGLPMPWDRPRHG